MDAPAPSAVKGVTRGTRWRADDWLAAADALPVLDLDALTGVGALVVVAPHPDDESLGCGGIIAEARARGRDVRVIVLSDGTGSHPNSILYPAQRLRAVHEAEASEAVRALGLAPDALSFLRLPDRAIPTEGPEAGAATMRIAAAAREAVASAILVTWAGDPHRDHQAAAQLAARAAAMLPGMRLLAYPVWAWSLAPDAPVSEGPPRGGRVDITRRLPAKALAVAAHRSQVTPLIVDDPEGSCLEPAMLARHARPHEILLEVGD